MLNILLNLDGSIPAWILLGLHYWLKISIVWFWLALGVWVLGLLVWMAVMTWVNRCSGPAPRRENKNPYSVTTNPGICDMIKETLEN